MQAGGNTIELSILD